MGTGRKHISSVLQAVHTLIQQWTPSVVYTHTVTKNTLVVLAVNTLIQQWPVLHSTPDWLQFNVECRPEAPSPLLFRLYPPSLSHLLPSHWPDGTAQGRITTFVAWLLLHTGSSRQSSFFFFYLSISSDSKCWLVALTPSPVHNILWSDDAVLSVQMLLHCQFKCCCVVSSNAVALSVGSCCSSFSSYIVYILLVMFYL